jgi:hypothetical protein
MVDFTGSRYLFPGQTGNRQRTPHSLRTLLAEHGLPNLAARNTAMMNIIAELPTPVVSDILSIHPGTAQRWSANAQADWAAYLAARDELSTAD